MHIKNGVQRHMETSATAIDWTEAVRKEAAKKAAKKYAFPRQNEQLLQALQGESTLENVPEIKVSPERWS